MSGEDTWYLGVQQLMDVLRDDRRIDLFGEAYERAIAAASSQIDQYCDDQFWLNPTPIARTFQAQDYRTLWTGSIGSATGLVVKFDLDDDGVFEYTVPSASWQLGPVNQRPDKPWDRIELLDSQSFPGAWRGDPYGRGVGHPGYGGYGCGYDQRFRSLRARVEVTARWGWPSVPWQVVQACQIIALDHFKSKDMSGTSAGLSPAGSSVFNAQSSYKTTATVGMNAQAEKLLCGLRDYVIA